MAFLVEAESSPTSTNPTCAGPRCGSHGSWTLFRRVHLLEGSDLAVRSDLTLPSSCYRETPNLNHAQYCKEMTQNSPPRTGCNDYTCAMEISIGPLSNFG